MKFRKKPIVIEAEQFWRNIIPYPKGVELRSYPGIEGHPGLGDCAFMIKTLEGYLKVSEGDWIITGVNEEKYPCKPDIFEKTYERVEEVKCAWNGKNKEGEVK